ncbi:MAG: type II toxin-antitoxin system PemK/MazF family toxin [Coriobacteriales bacterium]|nr:type II toxin-antitoxin system PemK/MazF family toxin [Coriobacteriales bacterium]
MQKDYREWMPVKAEIHNNAARPQMFKESDVWLCHIGDNVGFEEDGKGRNYLRPVVVVRKFNNQFCQVVPLSTTASRGRYYFPFNSHTGKTSVAITSQLKAVDSSRLTRKIGYINPSDLHALKSKLRELFQ